MSDDDKTRGLYPKYEVGKIIHYTDQRGEDVTTTVALREPFFVLRYSTDPHAWAALSEYANSCAADYPELAKDLMAEVRKYAPEDFYE